jgi:hypothetical protein
MLSLSTESGINSEIIVNTNNILLSVINDNFGPLLCTNGFNLFYIVSLLVYNVY